MDFKDVGWAMFCGESSNYSEAFQNEMSEQLYAKFCTQLRELTAKETDKFFLHGGMTEMRTISKDGYAFAFVDVISPDSLATTIKAYWKTTDEKNILQAVNDSALNKNNIEFGWCSDFEKEGFLQYFKRRKKLSKKKYNLNFEIEYDYTLYPDLQCSIYLRNTLPETSVKDIEEIFRKCIPGIYISPFVIEEKMVVGTLDFQKLSFKKGSLQLITVFENLSSIAIDIQIKKIIIE